MKIWSAVSLLLFGFILYGCSFSNQEEEREKPPPAVIEAGDTSIETTLGSYCWQGNGQATCIDTGGPQELLEEKEPIQVEAGEKMTFVMDYEPQPNKFHVLQISDNEEVAVTVEENSFTAPSEAGVYYYSFGVWWMDEEQENVSHGDAFYNFVIEVE